MRVNKKRERLGEECPQEGQVQRQKEVADYFNNNQLLPVGFTRRNYNLSDQMG